MSNVDAQVLTANDAERTLFQPINALPNELKPTSIQVLLFTSQYVDVEEDGKGRFNWPKFKEAINNYRGSDFAINGFNQSAIHQQTQEAQVMVEKVAKFLIDAFSASMDMTRLAAQILNTFTHLKERSDSSFLQFSSNKEKRNSSYEYRILFTVPFTGDDDSTYFYSLVTTITITADIMEESGWWGLTSSMSKNFGVQITAMEFVVKKGFTAPIN